MDTTRKDGEGAKANLGLWDATSIVMGIIIGVGIFQVPQDVFKQAPGPVEVMLVWALGGILAMIGALCFAELASAYPHSGGEYVYLSRAYGSMTGFLYGWAQLAVIRPASVAAIAYIFAVNANHVVDVNPLFLAVGAVVVLTAINILGATLGANTQNLLTAAKIIGLAGIVVYGLFLSPLHIPEPQTLQFKSGWFLSVMVLVLWTYAGWNEAAYISAEVKNPRRNLPLSLILGTLSVTVIYLLVNGAILLALGFDGARQQKNLGEILHGEIERKIFYVIVVISALGAINGMIFTTARIYSACGQDHRLFKSLSHWSRRGTPVRALVIQGLLNVGYLCGAAWASGDPVPDASAVASTVALLGSTDPGGTALVPAAVAAVGFQPMQPGGLKTLEFWADLTAPVFWFFFLLTGLSVLILRQKDPDTPRPFRTPFYPYLPIIFCGWCGYMVVASFKELPQQSFFGILVLLAGLPLYFLPRKKHRPRVALEGQPLSEETGICLGPGRDNRK
jgi:amino acid transporter